MKCVICGQPIEEGRRHGQPPREAKYCLKCRAARRRRTKLRYTWRPEYDAFLKRELVTWGKVVKAVGLKID